MGALHTNIRSIWRKEWEFQGKDGRMRYELGESIRKGCLMKKSGASWGKGKEI
jgi:hypothetical protein